LTYVIRLRREFDHQSKLAIVSVPLLALDRYGYHPTKVARFDHQSGLAFVPLLALGDLYTVRG
jgi:hypothetical protein